MEIKLDTERKRNLKKQNFSPISEFSGCHFGVLSSTLTSGDFLVKHQTFLAI